MTETKRSADVEEGNNLTTTLEDAPPPSTRRPVKSKEQFYYCFHKFIWVFPLTISILVPITCVAPYMSAIYYQHLEPIFPYVSDAGAHHPQAAFFSQMLDFLALCVLICTYARNKQIKFYLDVQNVAKCLDADQEHRVRKFNFFASLLGYLMSFGVFFIGNFRINEHLSGHLLGVTFAFMGMLAYEMLMLYITQRLYESEVESRPIFMQISYAMGVLGLLGCSIFSFIAILIVGFWKFADPSFRLNWKSDEPGFIWHMLGCAFEWIAILSVSPFYLCYFRRFYLFTHKYVN